MKTRIVKIGTSDFFLILPDKMLAKLGNPQEVDLTVKSGEIQIVPIKKRHAKKNL